MQALESVPCEGVRGAIEVSECLGLACGLNAATFLIGHLMLWMLYVYIYILFSYIVTLKVGLVGEWDVLRFLIGHIALCSRSLRCRCYFCFALRQPRSSKLGSNGQHTLVVIGRNRSQVQKKKNKEEEGETKQKSCKQPA